MSAALRFEGVRKTYGRARRPALDGLSFEVPRGSVCGLVGPNGAGKTTTFSVVSGFLPPDAGTVDLLGEGPFDPWRFKGRVGVLPQDAELPGRHTPVELLGHLARLQGHATPDAEARRRVDEVGLGDRADDRIDTLSHGMRRRVAVASALLGDPELVLLDEPTSGLDPVQAHAVRRIVAGIAGARTVVVSSHDLVGLEQMCDWVVMMERGRCVRQGSLEEVTGRRQRVVVELADPGFDTDRLTAVVPDLGVRAVDGRLVLSLPPAADVDAVVLDVMRVLVDAGVAVRSLRRGDSLEEAFLTGRNDA